MVDSTCRSSQEEQRSQSITRDLTLDVDTGRLAAEADGQGASSNGRTRPIVLKNPHFALFEANAVTRMQLSDCFCVHRNSLPWRISPGKDVFNTIDRTGTVELPHHH